MIGVTSFSNNGQSFRPHIGAEKHHWKPAQRGGKAEGFCIKSWLFQNLCLQIPVWKGCWEEEMWLKARQHWEGQSQPGGSPDLNPIENLWWLVKRRMSKERPSTQEDLKGVIRRAWNSVTPEDCYRLVSSMPQRIQVVIAAKGTVNKY